MYFPMHPLIITSATLTLKHNMPPSMRRKGARQQRKKNQNPQDLPNLLVKFTPGFGFPNQLEMKHKYVDEFTLTAALGVMANYRFRASGMFDPNHTATGHQPSYFDTMTGIYDHWLVTEATISLVVIPTTNPTSPTAFGIAINDDTTTTATTFVQYEESSNVKVNYLTFNDSAVRRLTLKYSPSRQFIGDAKDNRGLWGGIASDPGEETIFNVFLQAVDQVSNSATFCVATVTYTALWFELKDLTSS
jgi:hypothetical protein